MAKKIAYINSSGNTGLVSSSSWKDSNNNDHMNYQIQKKNSMMINIKNKKLRKP